MISGAINRFPKRYLFAFAPERICVNFAFHGFTYRYLYTHARTKSKYLTPCPLLAVSDYCLRAHILKPIRPLQTLIRPNNL